MGAIIKGWKHILLIKPLSRLFRFEISEIKERQEQLLFNIGKNIEMLNSTT